MKLISLQLCNFRQFYGKTPVIKFASGGQNTTVIHGNNGAGKTTLLNAFTWVLYEKFTAAFASPDLLINKRAITEANIGIAVDCWVELQFSHQNCHYQLKRKCYATNNKDDKIQYSPTKLFMLISAEDGRWYPPLEPPVDIIERILPTSLHQYFFFDGERIDRFFRERKNNNIAEDTKELLGVKVLDRAIDHLKKTKKSLQEELHAIGDIEIKQLLQEQIKLEQERDRLQLEQQEIVKELEKLQEQKQVIANQLLELSGANQLQQLKEKLVERKQGNKTNLIQAKNNLKQLITRQGYTVFLSSIVENFSELINKLKTNNRLGSGIQQEFIQQLLARQRCICGTELQPETSVFQHVRAWLEKAEMTDIEESTIRLETQVYKYNEQVTEFWQQLDQEQAYLNHQRIEIVRVENELDKINKKLRSYPDKDIQQLQKHSEEIEDTIKDLTLEQGANQQQLETNTKTIDKLLKQLGKHQLREEQQALARRRIQSTEEAIARLTEVRLRLERQFRLALEQKVGEIFNSISFTPYIPKLGTDYELTLVENTSGMAVPVAASTGENQILSLSFIGGIIERVRTWSQGNSLIGIDSSTFPVVMDSPFGSLDEIYRRQVAKSIPQLANQLVILATQTQWRGEVETEIADYIGKEYVLVYNSPKPDCQEDWLQVSGVSYPLVKRSSDEFEYTEIWEIERY
ncbi:AAA family ATPase [Pleurocapsales cyanobacterium LEGE 06147]|nr:AAA family ATPase [Pleurocapsales cyanobacterium LEGE 06147]